VSQDASSAQTGASIFDFDGDGRAEIVYADECFARIYDGETGKILFSSLRPSGTQFEIPVVADVDGDQNTEIVVNFWSGVTCGPDENAAYIDPLHPGQVCETDDDCIPGGACSEGYCRCSSSDDCDAGLTCQPPLTGAGNTCRATHPNKTGDAWSSGVRVLRDRLDRWVSSRPIWNQHAFSDTNVTDDGKLPAMSSWEQNFTDKELNNYRQNAQGLASVADIPDLTGKLDAADLCEVNGDQLVLTGRVCNRGTRAVGSKLPATFYDSAGEVLCVSYTALPVQGNGDCQAVSCQVAVDEVSGEVTMIVNDDGAGQRLTQECTEDNNSDRVNLNRKCVVVK
jgi:hypothetical protein